MNDFKQALKKRVIVAVTFFCGFLAVFLFLLWQKNNTADHVAEFINGYQVGGVCGLAVFALMGIVRYGRALRNNDYLKKLYIYETDERNRLIFEKAGSLGMNIVIFSLISAAIIAGFYNEIVALTLIVATIGVGIIRLTLKLYYGRRY